jgi:CrcB protein
VSAGVLIAAGLVGGAGAVARFLVDGAVAQRLGQGFPYGTLVVNLTGSFALGVLVGAVVAPDALRIAGSGFVGAYTTFSTWAFESHRLAEDGEGARGALNFAASVLAGVLIAWGGRAVGGAL